MGLCVLHCTHHARGAQRGCMASSPAEPGCASLARFGLPHAKLGAPVSMGEGEEGRGGSGTVVGAGSGYTRRAVSTPYMDCRSMRATRRPSSSALNSSTWERGGGGAAGCQVLGSGDRWRAQAQAARLGMPQGWYLSRCSQPSSMQLPKCWCPGGCCGSGRHAPAALHPARRSTCRHPRATRGRRTRSSRRPSAGARVGWNESWITLAAPRCAATACQNRQAPS